MSSPLDREALAALLKCLPELPFESARLLAMLIMTGCRRGEALAARWEDIDWQRKTIHFQRVLRFRNNTPEISGKMKTPSANRTVALWEPYLMYLGEPKEQGYIIELDGAPLTEQQYRKLWSRIMGELKRLGFKGSFTAHQLRHTYATVAANSGEVPIKVLQGMMGHANFQTTMNIYAGLDEYRMEESSRLLGEKYVSFTAEVAENLQQGREETP